MTKTPCPLLSESPEVIDAIDAELVYINDLPSRDRADGVDHGVAGQLVTLQVYVAKAMSAWTSAAGDEAALDVIRKLAGTCLRALILFGCPRRVAEENDPVQYAAVMAAARAQTPDEMKTAMDRLEEYQFEKAIADVIARLNRVGLTIDQDSLQALVWKQGTSPPQIINDRLYPGGGNMPSPRNVKLGDE